MSLLTTPDPASQMTLAPERSIAALEPDPWRDERRRCSDGGRLTLEQQLARVWEGLHAAGVATCPLCRGRMTEVADVGRCADCGTTLT